MAQRADVPDQPQEGSRAGGGPTGPPGDGQTGSHHVVIDIDPWSFVVLGVVVVVTVALFAIADIAGNVLTGIGVGVLVGVALSPVVSAVQRRWDTSRGLAVTVVGAGLSLGFAAVVTVVAPAAVSQLRDFSTELPSTVRDSYGWPIVGPRLEDADAAGQVERWIDDAPADIDDATLASMGERLIGGVLSAVVVLVTALGVMIDGVVVVGRLRSLVPVARRPQADRLGRIVYGTFGSYFAGSLFVAALAGFVTLCIGLVLGVPLAPVAGLWTTLTNLIPQIGGFLGGGFLVLLALTEGPLQAVIALGVFMAYQNLENNVISPAIVGKAVNLSPPTTMLAALAGGAAAGVPGALVATPLLGAVKAIYLDSRGEMPAPEPRAHHHVTRALRRRLPSLRRHRSAG